MQVSCSKCSRPIFLADVIESSAGRLSHLDCRRAQGLTPDERDLVVGYCFDSVVAHLLSWKLDFSMTRRAADMLGGWTNLCPAAGPTSPRTFAGISLAVSRCLRK